MFMASISTVTILSQKLCLEHLPEIIPVAPAAASHWAFLTVTTRNCWHKVQWWVKSWGQSKLALDTVLSRGHGTIPSFASTRKSFLGEWGLLSQAEIFTGYNSRGTSTYCWVLLPLLPQGSKAFCGSADIFFWVTTGFKHASNRLQKLQLLSMFYLPLLGTEFKARAKNRAQFSHYTHFNFSSVRVPRSEESCWMRESSTGWDSGHGCCPNTCWVSTVSQT